MDNNSFNYTKSRGEFYYKDILWNEYTTLDVLKRVETFKFKSTDIVINTFPRSGTTKSQEIIWQIKNRDLIKRGTQYGDIDKRFPFLEFNSKFYSKNDPFPIDKLESDNDTDSYRLIKTHCPLGFIESNLLEAKPKCIVVFRNPRDVCVSLFHFYRGLDLFGPWTGEWEEFVEIFCRGFTKCGSWLNWHQEWWREISAASLNPNPFQVVSKRGLSVLFYSFESLINQPSVVIKSIAEFLEEPLTPSQLNAILHNTNFKQMSLDESLNVIDSKTGFSFLRKGQIGNWKEKFSQEQIDRIYESIEKVINETGMNFEYE